MIDIVAQGTTCDWIELAALLPSGKMVRGHYVRSDDPDTISAWRKRFNNTNVFSSVGFYAEPDNGSASVLPLYFDIDAPDDLPTTRESALTLCEMLMDRTRVSQESLDIFFSGNKGFHVVVAPSVFRAFHSPHALALRKRMAQKAGAEGVRFLDESVYTGKRLWRLTNSRHSSSGLFKIPLRYEELRDISIDGIRKLAANPRPDDTLARHAVCEEAVGWYRKAISVATQLQAHSAHRQPSTTFRNGWRIPPCVKAIQEATLPDGIRHQTYLSLARFYRWIGMHPDEIRERIEEFDSRNPIQDPDSIERTVAWGCDHPGFPGCHNESLRRYCRPDRCFHVKRKDTRETNTHVTGK
jgi:hypothetical protein